MRLDTRGQYEAERDVESSGEFVKVVPGKAAAVRREPASRVSSKRVKKVSFGNNFPDYPSDSVCGGGLGCIRHLEGWRSDNDEGRGSSKESTGRGSSKESMGRGSSKESMGRGSSKASSGRRSSKESINSGSSKESAASTRQFGAEEAFRRRCRRSATCNVGVNPGCALEASVAKSTLLQRRRSE